MIEADAPRLKLRRRPLTITSMADLAAFQARRVVPTPSNELIKGYLPGSLERTELKARLASMGKERVEIPLVIGGREVRTGKTQQTVMPFEHRHVLATW